MQKRAALVAFAVLLAVAVGSVKAQSLNDFAQLNLYTTINSTNATIWQTCQAQQRALNASASAINATCTINPSCTTYNCTASDGTTRLTVSINPCVPSYSRTIGGNPSLASQYSAPQIPSSFNPVTDWSASPSNNITRTGFYNLTATYGNGSLPTTWYFPAEFCDPANRALRVGSSWRVNVNDRITPNMTWTQAIDLQIANARAGNVSGACPDVIPDQAYTQFTCNVPRANGSLPLPGVTPGIVASWQPCQREYLIFLNGTAEDPNSGVAHWFSPTARVNYRVPGTTRSPFFTTQAARVGGTSNTQNWTLPGGVDPPTGPQGNVPRFVQVNDNIIRFEYAIFYNTSNVSFASAFVYAPADACQWAAGLSSDAIAGIVTACIIGVGFIFVGVFTVFGKYL